MDQGFRSGTRRTEGINGAQRVNLRVIDGQEGYFDVPGTFEVGLFRA
jgi:hypothetical protein